MMRPGSRPTCSAVGDVNGDGRQDLATVEANDNTASIRLGNGDGTFQPAKVFAVGRFPVTVLMRDLNNDGRPDLAATNVDSNTVSVLLGNGDGTFQAQLTYPAGYGPFGADVGDVNGDGTLDLAVSDEYGNNMSVLLGNGDGTFQSPASYPTQVGPTRVAMGDLNLDGKLDITVANCGSSSVSVLLGNGDGTFQGQHIVSSQNGSIGVTLGDYNGDGLPDMAVADADAGLSVHQGNGDGTFQPLQAIAAGVNPYSVTTGDVNGDRRPDLVVANAGSSNVSVFLNTGNGNFTGQTTTVRVGNVYTVTNVGDSGSGSLRQAILNANTHSGPDTIQFAIVGVNKAITLSSALPTITGVVAIDGSTQAGVSVLGSRVSSTITGLAFATTASDSYVGTLTISGFKGIGIAATNAKVTLQSNTLTGNKTGISLSASPASLIGGSDAAMGNMLSGNNVGIALAGACTGTVVDRNMLSGNGVGVSLSNATGVQVGVVGNTIAGSTSYGVQATGSLAGSFVQANAITGTTFYGVYLSNAANLMVMGNTISDGKPQGAGLYAVGTLTNTVVQGNTIRNNRGSGVLMDNARGITIGLTAGGAGVANTIVNNSGFGLRAWGTSTGSAVRRNIISGNNVDVQIAAAKGLTYVPLVVNRVVPISHARSAPNASVLFLKGPSTGPSTGPISAHQNPSLSGSTWLARVICNLPSSRRSSVSS